jgi:ribosomal protein S18 acetylase RimI-like enzyme
MTINVVQGTRADVDELAQLYDDLNDFLAAGTNYPGWKKGVYPVREIAESGIDAQNLFVAKTDGRIVGSIILNHEAVQGYDGVEWLCDAGADEVLIVHTLAVHPGYRNTGIATLLLRYAELAARQKNVKALRLDVYAGNTPAIGLYESFGYRRLATIDLGLGCHGLDWFYAYEKVLSK